MRKQLTVTIFFFISLIITTLVACKKNKEEPNIQSNLTLLTQKAWHPILVQERSSPADAWQTNNISEQPCAKDDIYTFSSNGSYVWDEGPSICFTGNSQIAESGNFVFANNETHLTVNITNMPGITLVEEWTIEQLDENTLIYNFYFSTGPYYRYTMSH